MAEYKQCPYSLRKSIKQAKRQYRDKVESQFNGSNTRRMWQGLQTITDYKKKTSPDLFPDKSNNFFAHFEDNTKTVGSPSPWPTSVQHLNVLTFARLVAQTASLAASSEHAQTSWLAGVYGHFQSLPIPVCCPHMLQDGHHCSCTQKGKDN